jgi:hypothetical protein
MDDDGQAIAVEMLCLIVLSLCLSYSIGMTEGLRSAVPDRAHPLVSLQVIQGTNLDEAWLYERTDSDYRLVTSDGSNHIVPAANVKEIKGIKTRDAQLSAAANVPAPTGAPSPGITPAPPQLP